MQVNVMAWLTVAWAMLLWTAWRERRALFAVLAVLSLLPLAANAVSLSRFRGGDSRALAALAAIERALPPEKTVFVYWGFEDITMWQYALWSRTRDWDGTPNDAKFKWIALDAGAIRHARWTPEQNAKSIRGDLEAAFARGYRVVIGDGGPGARPSSPGMSARCPPPTAHRRSTRCCTATTRRPEAARCAGETGSYYELRRR